MANCYLSYFVVVIGIEPIFSEPKSDVLPLDDTTLILGIILYPRTTTNKSNTNN